MYCSIYSSCYRCVVAAFVRIPFPGRGLPCGGLYKSIKNIRDSKRKRQVFFRNLPWGVPYPPLQSAFFCRLFPYAFSCPCRPLPSAVYLYTYIIPAKPGGFAGNSAALRDGSRPGRLRGYPFRSRCFDRNLRTGSSYSFRHSQARITEPKKSARAPGSDSRNVRSPFLTQA